MMILLSCLIYDNVNKENKVLISCIIAFLLRQTKQNYLIFISMKYTLILCLLGFALGKGKLW